MIDPTDSARDDLAFIRALVSEAGQAQDSLGEALLAGGLCYGIQCVLQAILSAGVAAPVAVHIVVGVAPSVIFILLMMRIALRDKGRSQHAVATRAINAAFGGSGLAALTTAAIFGYLVWRTGNMGTWLLHPVMICVVQGVVWYIAFAIRRRGWLGLVSAGWFAVALALTVVLGSGSEGLTPLFLSILAAALLGLMALPGWVLQRGARG